MGMLIIAGIWMGILGFICLLGLGYIKLTEYLDSKKKGMLEDDRR